jgi:hypothetical protein
MTRTRTRKMVRMENSVDLMTERSAYDRSGVREYRINLQPAPTGRARSERNYGEAHRLLMRSEA